MAKDIIKDLKVKLDLENEKVLTELKSSLRGISSVAKVSEKDLLGVAKSVKEYSSKSKDSIAVIKGQVNALKGLQEQARLNSNAFKSLGKDIELYESKLKSAEQTTETSRAAIRRRGTFVKAAPGRFLEREEYLRGKPSELPFGEEGELRPEFMAQQTQLNVLAEARIRLEGRLEAKIRATTKALVDNSPKLRTAAEIVKTFGAELNELPRTTSNVQMELRELRTDLSNLVIGGEEYISTLNRINQLQAQLDIDPLDPTGRKADIRSRLGTIGRFGGETDPVAKSIARNRRKRERGMLPPLLLDQPREASGLFRTIASIGSSEARAATEMMGRSLKQVTTEIKNQAAASNGSVNSLQAQRNAFAQLRASIDPTSQDFRELGKEIDKVDRKLGKLGKKRGINLRGAAQTVGAVASAGIFGGAAGVAGALAGAPFGPGGAVVGAGIGTSVGVAAQQISSFTDYAASIRLAEKAMKRLIAVEGDRIETARRNAIATQTIEYAVNKLNVEREDATVGMTRLSAAVLGAGGNIETAALAFLGTTKAIKATKGSADDVRGGLTALVQMFSKGRISAEELSGQLGERFPAAVTAFAEANNISTQELQALLKKGEVGLDKLVSFLAFAVEKYSEGSLEMAASAEESGQRQARAFDQVRQELGNQLIDVGAKLQEGIADSLAQLTPVIVNTAKVVAGAVELIIDGIVLVVKNFRNLSDAFLTLAGGAVIGVLVKSIMTLSMVIGRKGLVFAVKLAYRTIVRSLIPALGLVIGKIKALTLVMMKNPFILIATGITAIGVAAFRAKNRYRDFMDDITNGAMSLGAADKRVKQYQERLEKLNKINAIIQASPGAEAGLSASTDRRSRARLSGDALKVANLAAGLRDNDLPEIRVGNRQALRRAIVQTQGQVTGAKLAIQGRGAATGDMDLDKIIEEALKGKPDLALDLPGKGSDRGPIDMLQEELDIRDKIREATLSGNEAAMATAKFELEITKAVTESKGVNDMLNKVRQARLNHTIALKKIEEDRVKLDKQLQQSLENRKLQLGLITQEEFNQLEIARERSRLKDLGATPEQIEEQMRVFKQLINQTPIDKFIKNARDSLNDLQTVAVNVAQGIGDAVGNALTNGINSLIEGTKNAKEVFADFLKSVGQMLAQEGAKMIATYIAIGVAKAFAGFAGSGGSDVKTITTKYGAFGAEGAANAAASLPPVRANGGPVNAGRPYMVGERGPELFVPGQSGGIMRNEEMRRLMGRSPAGAGSQPSMNFTFETTNIGGTEYVSREQLEAAMATTRRQAANDGARRGMSMTLDKMQNSPRTRSRIGIS